MKSSVALPLPCAEVAGWLQVVTREQRECVMPPKLNAQRRNSELQNSPEHVRVLSLMQVTPESDMQLLMQMKSENDMQLNLKEM